MVINNIVDKLRNRTFELKCPKMQLCVTPAYHIVLCEGAGRIWVSDRGRMFYSMVATNSNWELEREWFPRLKIFGQHPRAMSIRKDEYLQLRAWDIDGNEWVSNWLIPCVDPRKEGVEYCGQIDKLSSCQTCLGQVEKESVEFVILHPPKMPFRMSSKTTVEQDGVIVGGSWTVNRQFISVQGLRVHLEEVGEERVLRCTIESEDGQRLKNHIAVHIVEALRFVTGTFVQPIYYCQRSSDRTVIHLEGNVSEKNWESHLVPPVWARTPEEYDIMWEVFKTYLVFLLNQSCDIAEYHPISWEYYGVMQASIGSLEGYALAVSVAVEAILSICAKPMKVWEADQPKDLNNNISGLIDHIKGWNGDAHLINRTIGCIDRFQERRAGDLLWSMKKNRVVSEAEVYAWKELRNQSAHGGAYQESDKEKMYKLVRVVSGMLHRIVLYEIGYKGQFTNYSNDDWPLVTWDSL